MLRDGIQIADTDGQWMDVNSKIYWHCREIIGSDFKVNEVYDLNWVKASTMFKAQLIRPDDAINLSCSSS